jgi:hypothetical protein
MGGAVDYKVPLDDHAAAARLLGLLDYVDALVKLDERVPMRLSQHKLQDGSQFILYEHELTKLPGVSLNKSDDDGPIWLRVQRLQRTAPPIVNQEIAEWVEVSQDPDVVCTIKTELHKRLTEEEKETLLRQGRLRPEDCLPSLKEEKGVGKGAYFDVFFRLEDQLDTQNACSDYVSNVWGAWVERELPRRRSIQAYQKLFEIAQRLSQSGASESVELVWGIGITRWSKGSTILDLPVLELSVEIEIADDRGADIFVRPRNTPARIDLRAFDKLAENQVALAEQASHRIICGDSATLQGNERDIVFLSMEAMNIKPIGQVGEPYKFTEHREVGDEIDSQTNIDDASNGSNEEEEILGASKSEGPANCLEAGDRIILKFLDRENAKPEFFILVDGPSDESNGLLGLSSALAVALSYAEPEDEITIQLEGENRRLMLVALESAGKEAA